MADSDKTDIQESSMGSLFSSRCDTRFRFISHMKDSESFDDLDFYNYSTGKYIKGAELRDCQTGCEIFEKLGWNEKNSPFGRTGMHKCGCKQFDEQLCFVSEEGKPLSNYDYCVTLADGRQVRGTTDDNGKTKRIKNTQKEQPIEQVEFFASDYTQPLCPQNAIKPGKRVKKVTFSNVKTTQENIGSSVRQITIKGAARPLTSGEIAMARLVFKDSIDYAQVKVHKDEYLIWGLQNDKTIMAPNGEIYCNPQVTFREDFSIEGRSGKIWFMHEMAHVWQWQLGYRIRIKLKGFFYGLISSTSKFGSDWVYKYDSTEIHKTLPNYNMEQQAEIISHYFGANPSSAVRCR